LLLKRDASRHYCPIELGSNIQIGAAIVLK